MFQRFFGKQFVFSIPAQIVSAANAIAGLDFISFKM